MKINRTRKVDMAKYKPKSVAVPWPPKLKNPKLTAVGAYIFAGGFTAGVAQHFRVLAHLEEGPFGTVTAKANFPWIEIHTDPTDWPGARHFSKVDFVFCNPPCAPWSAASAGRKTTWREDPRTSCVSRSFELLERYKPAAWCFESVRGAYTRGREMIDEMTAKAKELGYKTTHVLIDGQEHGLPQRRRRYFMLCHRLEVPWSPTNKDASVVGEVLASVKDPGFYKQMRPDVLELAKQTEHGAPIRRTFDRLNRRRLEKHKAKLAEQEDYEVKGAGREKHNWLKGRPNFLTCVLNPDTVCGVVIGNNKVHPNRDRMIGIEEAKAICGYPKGFDFKVKSKMFGELTKAVMPPVGEWLAAQVKAMIEQKKPLISMEPDEAWAFADRVVVKPPSPPGKATMKTKRGPGKTGRGGWRDRLGSRVMDYGCAQESMWKAYAPGSEPEYYLGADPKPRGEVELPPRSTRWARVCESFEMWRDPHLLMRFDEGADFTAVVLRKRLPEDERGIASLRNARDLLDPSSGKIVVINPKKSAAYAARVVGMAREIGLVVDKKETDKAELIVLRRGASDQKCQKKFVRDSMRGKSISFEQNRWSDVWRS